MKVGATFKIGDRAWQPTSLKRSITSLRGEVCHRPRGGLRDGVCQRPVETFMSEESPRRMKRTSYGTSSWIVDLMQRFSSS